MEERLKSSLEQIIYILQERDGELEYSRLIKILLSKGRDEYYSIEKLLYKLKEMDLIEDKQNAFIKLTLEGQEFEGFDHLDHQKYQEHKAKELNIENLELQNEGLRIQNLSMERQIEIDTLTIENLRLQNKQMKRDIIYSIIGFTAGAIMTNITSIIEFLKF